MKDNFANCLSLVLKYEGGYSDNRNDPGGATMQGITQKVYDDYRQLHGRPKTSVRGILPAERDAIYRGLYWDTIGADTISTGLDLLTFDIAVNSGPGKALEWLRATHYLAPVARIKALDARRRGFWKSLGIFRFFGRGWFNREDDIVRHALAMATPKTEV